jgi:hypothetical protein
MLRHSLPAFVLLAAAPVPPVSQVPRVSQVSQVAQASQPASAEPAGVSDGAVAIPGLYDTGVDDAGVVQPIGVGVVDLHYALQGAATTAFVISEHAAWIDPPAGSAWIGPSNGSVTDPAGEYTYTLAFDLTGLDPTTASISGSWAVDNSAVMLLNGVATGDSITVDPFTVLHPFTLSGGFVAGVNTLEFVVDNPTSTGLNPTGLLVSGLEGTAEPDEPFTPIANGCPGTHGVPLLAGMGDPSPDQRVTVVLASALGNASCTLMIGLDEAQLVRLGCTLLFHPALVVPMLTDAGGGASVSGRWPAGLPPGFLLHTQWVVVDPGAPIGYATSNTLVIESN